MQTLNPSSTGKLWEGHLTLSYLLDEELRFLLLKRGRGWLHRIHMCVFIRAWCSSCVCVCVCYWCWSALSVSLTSLKRVTHPPIHTKYPSFNRTSHRKAFGDPVQPSISIHLQGRRSTAAHCMLNTNTLSCKEVCLMRAGVNWCFIVAGWHSRVTEVGNWKQQRSAVWCWPEISTFISLFPAWLCANAHFIMWSMLALKFVSDNSVM